MRKSVLYFASPFVVGMLWATTPACLADDAATSNPAGGGEWFRQPAPSSAPAGGSAPQGNIGDDRRVFPPYNDNGDYPSRDLRDWVFANAHAATARAIFSRAENDLAAAYRRSQHQFERSKAFLEASADEKDAYDSYNAARQKAMRELNEDPKYRELLRLRDELADQIAIKRTTKKRPRKRSSPWRR